MTRRIRISGIWLLPAVLVLTSCSRAPSFDILGSFFPAWLVCLALGVLFTGAVRWLSQRIRVPLLFPVLTWPSLAALFTLVTWLVFFDQ